MPYAAPTHKPLHVLFRERNPVKRPSSAQRGYGRKWAEAARAFLIEHPHCVDCSAEGKQVSATVVDHHIPHKGDRRLFWDRSNWQGLCRTHHAVKTAKYDGGFGNPMLRSSSVPGARAPPLLTPLHVTPGM